MTNFEKYAKEYIEKQSQHSIDNFICYMREKNRLEPECDGACYKCTVNTLEWLNEEYQLVDWSKVAVDTPIIVSEDKDFKRCFKRYFKGYNKELKQIEAWYVGATSWSAENYSHWNYAKLADTDID